MLDHNVGVFLVRGTKRFLDRVPHPVDTHGDFDEPANLLGDWYANVLFWRPQVALFVNERTLLPVFLPMAPAATVALRFPDVLGNMLTEYGFDAWFTEVEAPTMDDYCLAPTQSRSVLASMNDFVRQARYWKNVATDEDALIALSLRLAATPCGPLFKSEGSPDRELAEFIRKLR